jgi:hypothetical protein
MENLVALRDKKTQEVLNISYSSEGLKYTFNQAGRNMYENKFTEVVPYKFIAHKNPRLRKQENKWAWKARVLLRPVKDDIQEFDFLSS